MGDLEKGLNYLCSQCSGKGQPDFFVAECPGSEVENSLWRKGLDPVQELCNALSLGAKGLGRYTSMTQVRCVKIHVVESFATQSVWYQEGIPDQTVDPPFFRCNSVSLKDGLNWEIGH
jgi:hypothetical protein